MTDKVSLRLQMNNETRVGDGTDFITVNTYKVTQNFFLKTKNEKN
jgi:hypothetical protein